MDRRVIKKPSAMKRPTSSATRFIPKRGIARMVTRKPASRPGYVRRVAYTRVARPSRNRTRDSQPSVRLLDLLKGTKWTTNHLLSHGFLKVPDRCDVCGHRREAFTKGKRHGARSQARCSSYQCRRRLSIFTGNPFFTNRAPAVSVMNQAAILYNLCIGVSRIHTHQQLGVSHGAIERYGLRFEEHLSRFVEATQEKVKLGGDTAWADVECDEVTLLLP